VPSPADILPVPRSAGLLRPILAIAHNDLRLLMRDRMNCFFTFVFPVIFALLFGFIFGGAGSSSSGRMSIAIIDSDNSAASRQFVEDLSADTALAVKPAATQEQAEALVRTGKVAACIIVPKGFEEQSRAIFSGQPLRLSTLVDPSRKAEAGLLQGKLYQAAFNVLGRTFTDPAQLNTALDTAQRALSSSTDLTLAERAAFGVFFATMKNATSNLQQQTTADNAAAPTTSPLAGWSPLDITITELAAPAKGEASSLGSTSRKNPRSAFQVSYGQGVVWGLMGCVVAFIAGLSSERVQGTLSRLLIAPLRPSQVLLGKALACFVACLLVQALLLGAVMLASLLAEGGKFSVQSWPMLALTACASALCLTALMMALGTMVRSEAGGAGMGRAVLLVLAIVGGGTVPVFLMPAWMQTASAVSPFHWSVLAIDGAVWRGFSPSEFVVPIAVLLTTAAIGITLGSLLMHRVRAG
jgi:ABC-2 type transport system permease protein